MTSFPVGCEFRLLGAMGIAWVLVACASPGLIPEPSPAYVNAPGCQAEVARHTADPSLAVDSLPRVRRARIPPSVGSSMGYSLRDPGEPLPTGRGTTSVTFVVDETGAVDLESLAVTATDQPRDVTERAVAALAEWTFQPGRTGICWVPKRMRVDWVWGR